MCLCAKASHVPPVLVGDLVAFFRRILTVVKTAKLFVLIDVQPEFQDDCAPVGQSPFKTVDFVVCTAPLLVGAKAFNMLHQHASIPGAVKNGDMPILWKGVPETPQMRVVLFNRARRGNGNHLIAARVKRLRNPLDIAALPGRVPSFICEDQRDFFKIQPPMQLG